MSQPALLALENGAIFYGRSIGIEGCTVGEVIFNTSMTGYQEILTDPSYASQIVTFTYPHIGNVGVNKVDMESGKTWALGVVVRDLSLEPSNWRAESSLQDFLIAHRMLGIAGIDTRRLAHIIRDQGAQNACLMAGELDPSKALNQAREFPGIKGMDLARVVSVSEPYVWEQGSQYGIHPNATEHQFHVLVYDYGVKQQILRMLVDRGCRLTVIAADTPLAEAKQYQPDGVFLSNGPGDPAACHYAPETINYWLENNTPTFGICLGFQLLALSCGAQTIKMKFGHHGANHPVLSITDQKVLISSQNHGFAVEESSLPSELRVTHRSLFDNTLQGIEHVSKPAFGFQGHPEASPGPHDLSVFFDRFIEMMIKLKSK